jgi:ABC-type sugar transport system substrate-binding protein
MAETLDYLKTAAPSPKKLRIAYLAECTNNPYCQSRLAGARAAAAKLGLDLKVFDANFTPNTQLGQVQDAIQQNFDGYIFIPVADSSGCANYKLLKATGKPVVTANSPMCGDPDYTQGTSGFVAMQTEAFFQQHAENAFASCSSDCDVMAIGGYVGSDLFTRWETALKAAAARYPKAHLVVDQPGNFDPQVALAKTQDALRAHPSIQVVVSSWDDMTRGVEQAITVAGKKPGTGIRIYSVGATKGALSRIRSGAWTESTVLLPYEESYYALAQVARKLVDGKDTAGFTNLMQAPVVVDGPGSIFITATNLSKFNPEY